MKKSTVSAPKSTTDMLDAFEERLQEIKMESSTKVEASDDLARRDRQVEIYGEDYQDKYEDVGGGFGNVGEVYNLAEIKEIWNDNNTDDYSMEVFPNFDSWWENTRVNFMVEV